MNDKQFSKCVDLYWVHGEGFQQSSAFKRAKLPPPSPGEAHRISKASRQRLVDRMIATNADSLAPITCVFARDPQLDPDLNPDHPIAVQRTLELDAIRHGPYGVEADGAISEARRSRGLINTNDGRAPNRHDDEPNRKAERKRYELLGYPVTAVLRWMGANGFGWQQALKACNALGVNCAEGTCKIQTKRGLRKDPDFSIPTLTKAQATQLRSAAK